MPKAADLKKGAIIEMDEQLYQARNIEALPEPYPGRDK